MNLLGIYNNPTIIKNSHYEKVSLTWRTLMHSFIVSEENVIQKNSILISKENTAKTASMSALLYLISDLDFSTINSIEDKKIKEARKHAVEKYILEELDSLCKRKKYLDENLQTKNFLPEDEIKNLTEQLVEIEKEISLEINNNKNTLGEIISIKDKIAECDLLLNRYSALRSQYKADIKRLSFIVEGESNFSQVTLTKKCPFCDSIMSKENDYSYMEIAKSELWRITQLLNDLYEIEKTIRENKQFYQKTLENLHFNRQKIENIIEKTLNPKAKKIKESLQDYKEILNLQNEIEIVKNMYVMKEQKLNEMRALKDHKEIEFKPREYFPQNFVKTLSKILDNILIRCRYENYINSEFSIKNFDIIINGKDKENYGKGYRAFLNIILALAMREYLDKNSKYPTTLFIVDSPLLSLKQNIDDIAPESMKIGLIEYLITTQHLGQTILIENEIPHLDYKTAGVKLHQFTKNTLKGRYGLLLDVIN